MSDPAAAVVSCRHYRPGEPGRDLALDAIAPALAQGEGFVWLGLHEPGEPLMRQVQDAFGLHELAVEDAHTAHQRPKVERYDESLFVALRTAWMEGDKLRFGETHLFLGRRYLVTVRHGAAAGHARVRAACERRPERMAWGPAYPLYALLDALVDQFFPIVNGLDDHLARLEDELLFRERIDQSVIRRIYRFQRQIMKVRRAVVPLAQVCSALMSTEEDLIPTELKPYLRDVADHVGTVTESVDSVGEIVLTALNVNASLVSVRQNEATKRLAGWGAILAVPTMLFSVYGMNFDYMPELRWHWAYPVLMAAAGGLCVLLYFRLRRAGWL